MNITSRQNPSVRDMRNLLRDKKERRLKHAFVIEGEKMCLEAMKNGCEFICEALVTLSAAEKYAGTVKKLESKCGVSIINNDIGEYISDTSTPQGIFAAIKILDKSIKTDILYNNSAHVIILDNLQDTGNIGTIIRTCDAMGIDGLILGDGCADIYSPKVVRSTMGSIFRLPCVNMTLTEAIPLLKKNGFTVYGAMLDERALKLGKFTFPQKTAVVIGNEGNGISDTVKELCTQSLYIEIKNAESLNAGVAAAIVCYEMKK